MTRIVKDRVLETTTTTGTGNLSLAGAVTGYRAFDDVMANGDTCYYVIEAVDGNGIPTGEWETGLATFNDTDTLVRTKVISSSNADAAVNLSAGTKRVAMSQLAAGFLVIEGTYSAAATVDFEQFADLDAKKITIEIEGSVSVDGAGLNIQYKLNGSYQSGAGSYRTGLHQISSSGANNTDETPSGTAITVPTAGGTWGIGNATDESYVITLQLANPGSSRNKRLSAHGNHGGPSGVNIAFFGGGTYEGTDKGSPLQGIRLTTSSGTTTGSYRIKMEV